MRGTRAATRPLLVGTAVAAAVLTLPGCSHTVSVGATRTIRVALTEYRVIPQSIRSKPGQLTLEVENDGRLAHTLAVSSRGNVLGQTPPLQPGASTSLTLSLRPGSYLMTSTLQSDQALGEYGTLTVVR
jgi:hypothetical protein